MSLAAFQLWPEPCFTDTNEGLRARVADPVWFLARQWQLGELQGEDVSHPTRVLADVTHAPITYDLSRQSLDPTTIPAEALLEAEPGDWWTMGRRVRIGRVAMKALRVKYPDADDSFFDRWRLADLPAPYDEFSGQIDAAAVFVSGELAGHQLWRDEDVPSPPPDRFSSSKLCYEAGFTCRGRKLVAREHDGGDVDWFTVDGAGVSPIGAKPARHTAEVIPGRLTYPGAPHRRWWQVEDHAVDIGGFAPDRSHLGTALLYDVALAHSDDWFWFPVPEPPAPPPPEQRPPSVGVVVSLRNVRVIDSFDEKFSLHPPAPTEWSLFHTRGMPVSDLVIWPVAVAPHAGPLLDEVVLGVDEDANLAWAIELRADGVALLDDVATTEAVRETTRTGTRNFTYKPSTTLPARWHPYERIHAGDTDPVGAVGDGRSGGYRQAILADLTGPIPQPRPGPRSRLIGGPSGPGAGRGHTIDADALPSTGIRIQRRARLARATDGQPVLWNERRVLPLLGPPTSHLRFDVLTEAPDERRTGG